MKPSKIISLFLIFAANQLLAGNLNVINLTGEDPLKLILSGEGADKPLSVDKQASSGSFILADVPVTLKNHSEDLPELEIPVAPEHRLAILFPVAGTTEWRVLPSKAGGDKWSFRVINLTGEPVTFSHSGDEILMEKDEEIQLKTAGGNKIGIKLPGGKYQAYPYREPCAVIAFLSKDGEITTVTFVSDI